MNLTHFERVYANGNSPSGARIASAIILFVAAGVELLLGVLYAALMVFGVWAVFAALFLDTDVIGQNDPKWNSLLIGLLLLIVFREQLSRWSIVQTLTHPRERRRQQVVDSVRLK